MMNIIKKHLKKADYEALTIVLVFLCMSFVIALVGGCHSYKNEFPLDLTEIVETGYGNTVDGDSMYWAIYEEWDVNNTRHLLYMDKETFDSLEAAVALYHSADSARRDSINNAHGFTLFRDSEGLHLGSIR